MSYLFAGFELLLLNVLLLDFVMACLHRPLITASEKVNAGTEGKRGRCMTNNAIFGQKKLPAEISVHP